MAFTRHLAPELGRSRSYGPGQRAAGSWPQSHGWGAGWTGAPALPGWLSRRADQPLTRRVAWPVTWAWGYPEWQPQPPWPPGDPTLVLPLHPLPAPAGPSSVWALVHLGSLSAAWLRGTHFPPAQRHPQWPPSVLPISGVWGPRSACTARPPRPSLGSTDLGLNPLLFFLPPSPLVDGARPSPSVGRPPAAWAQVRGLLRAPAALGLPSPLTPRPTPPPSSWPRSRCSHTTATPSRLRLPRAPPTPWETPPLLRAFSCGACGHPSCCLTCLTS